MTDGTFKSLGEITNSVVAKLQPGRHAWDAPVRPDLNNTFRTCRKCGLVKVTRHEDDNNPRHWIEFERDGAKVSAAKTPVCEEAA